jgi:single-stranded-DNA-specific exonuclease
MREQAWFDRQNIQEPNLAELLDIVAVGTVADLVPLDKNNRILVEQGLKRIRSGLACAGIKALLQVAKRNQKQCQASDLGFAVGPRINAAGRLDDISVGIECLLSDNYEQALSLAAKLDNLNRSRKSIEKDMVAQATEQVEACLKDIELCTKDNQNLDALCLYNSGWHQGVIGILASRIKEKINRPVIIFAQDENLSADNKPLIKGSSRSVMGLHIRDALAWMDSQYPALIEKFGGHAMAAGLTIKQENFDSFKTIFQDYVKLNGDSIKDEVITDGELQVNELSLDFAYQIRQLGPWGQGFPEPIFNDDFVVVNHRILAEEHLKLILEKQNYCVDAIFFRYPKNLMIADGERVRVVYKLAINDFRGNQTPQLMIEQLEILV